jgi:hypothetical protein
MKKFKNDGWSKEDCNWRVEEEEDVSSCWVILTL